VSDFNDSEFSRHILLYVSNMKHLENPSSVSPADTRGQTDRWTGMTKLVGAFHDYTRKSPKENHIILPENCGWTNYNYHDLQRRTPSAVHKEQLIQNRCLTSYPQPVKRYDNGSRRTFVLTSVTSASTQLLTQLWVWLYLSDVRKGR